LLRVQIQASLTGFPAPHQLTLTFRTAKRDLGIRRMCVLVGSNGAGKTQLLAARSGRWRRLVLWIPRE
jgi:ABC-type uncharacterized transport system ATPase subunit